MLLWINWYWYWIKDVCNWCLLLELILKLMLDLSSYFVKLYTLSQNLEYHLKKSTFVIYKLIFELSFFGIVWDWFWVMNCVIFFSYCFYFMCRFRWYIPFILLVWIIFNIDCILRGIKARCCRNLHVKCSNDWKSILNGLVLHALEFEQ